MATIIICAAVHVLAVLKAPFIYYKEEGVYGVYLWLLLVQESNLVEKT